MRDGSTGLHRKFGSGLIGDAVLKSASPFVLYKGDACGVPASPITDKLIGDVGLQHASSIYVHWRRGLFMGDTGGFIGDAGC
jgi:hypothetical protein